MDFSGYQLRAARAFLGLDQAALAKAVGVSINTIKTMERCGDEPVGGFASTRNKVLEALKAMGIEFVNGDAPGVLWLRKRGKAMAGKSPGSARVRSKKTSQRKR